MAELANCSCCEEIFVRTYRDICRSCYQAEEDAFLTVYRFLSKRENREATVLEIEQATGVAEALISKFIKEGRLLPSKFPQLTYPCEHCGVGIVKGKLCDSCAEKLKTDLQHYERQKEHMIDEDTISETIYRFR